MQKEDRAPKGVFLLRATLLSQSGTGFAFSGSPAIESAEKITTATETHTNVSRKRKAVSPNVHNTTEPDGPAFSMCFGSLHAALPCAANTRNAIDHLVGGCNELYAEIMRDCSQWPECQLLVLMTLRKLMDFYQSQMRLLYPKQHCLEVLNRKRLHNFVSGRYSVLLLVEYDGGKQFCCGNTAYQIAMALKHAWMRALDPDAQISTSRCFLHASLIDLENPVDEVLRFARAVRAEAPYLWIREIESPAADLDLGLVHIAAEFRHRNSEEENDDTHFKMCKDEAATLYKAFCYEALKMVGCRGDYYGLPLV
jgi:hypothetical protein